MIKVTINGEDMPYDSYEITESFNNYATEVRLSLFNEVYDNTVEINGYPFLCVASESSSIGKATFRFLPKLYQTLLSKQFPPVNENLTFEKLMETKYGIKTSSQFKSQSVYWCLPQMKLSGMIELVKNRVVVPAGGGVCMTFGMNNKLRFSDLKKASSSSDAIPFSGMVVMSSTDLKWIPKVPGKYQMIKHLITEDKEYDLEIQKDAGIGTLNPIIFNEKSEDSVDVEVTNIFNRKLYTSRVVTFKEVEFSGEPYIGCTLIEANSGLKYVLWQIKATGTMRTKSIEIIAVSKV